MAGQSMRDIKRRIASVKSTQKITKALEMVSAAKLRRAQNRATAGRPFADKLREVLVRLVAATRAGEGAGTLDHPLLEAREVKRVLYVVVTADRGLAGGYNSNILRRLRSILEQERREYGVIVIGRKARDYVRKQKIEPVAEHVYLGDEIDYLTARQIAGELMQAFTSRTYDAVYLLYTEFISAMSQRPRLEQVLPIADPGARRGGAPMGSSGAAGGGEERVAEYIYEPSPDAVLSILLPRYVETEVYRALMEAKASEHAARMTAMRNASDNAGEMIEALTLSFNRARQASITKEISEIVGGAEALATTG